MILNSKGRGEQQLSGKRRMTTVILRGQRGTGAGSTKRGVRHRRKQPKPAAASSTEGFGSLELVQERTSTTLNPRSNRTDQAKRSRPTSNQ
jgi:hypothetical protein